MKGHARARFAGTIGIAWGAVLFAYPDDVWQRVAGRGCTQDEQLVTQVLGLRHLAQGLAELVAPRAVRRPAAAVDAAHALSMLALAAWRREYAPPALASAAVALGGAALSSGGRGGR
ncbi:hypothetical protein [Terrabacter terrigena]|uniref:Uncharacterized protein n=1 Tax=Terrabacter terrigena TaxID=574718 RepID=A0ABW3MU30_9MICO